MTKAIDMHVHLPTGSFLNGAIKPDRLPAEKFFRGTVPIREMEEVARKYEELDMIGVLLAWDAETATKLPSLSNDEVADVVRKYPKRIALDYAEGICWIKRLYKGLYKFMVERGP
jgi:hypothetical protein